MSRRHLLTSSQPIWDVENQKIKIYNKHVPSTERLKSCSFCSDGNVCFIMSESGIDFHVCRNCLKQKYNREPSHSGKMGSCESQNCPCLH